MRIYCDLHKNAPCFHKECFFFVVKFFLNLPSAKPGVYLLQILDAHVDAHLQDYDISDDLSMNVEPYFDLTSVGSQPVYGLNMSLKF